MVSPLGAGNGLNTNDFVQELEAGSNVQDADFFEKTVIESRQRGAVNVRLVEERNKIVVADRHKPLGHFAGVPLGHQVTVQSERFTSQLGGGFFGSILLVEVLVRVRHDQTASK